MSKGGMVFLIVLVAIEAGLIWYYKEHERRYIFEKEDLVKVDTIRSIDCDTIRIVVRRK